MGDGGGAAASVAGDRAAHIRSGIDVVDCGEWAGLHRPRLSDAVFVVGICEHANGATGCAEEVANAARRRRRCRHPARHHTRRRRWQGCRTRAGGGDFVAAVFGGVQVAVRLRHRWWRHGPCASSPCPAISPDQSVPSREPVSTSKHTQLSDVEQLGSTQSAMPFQSSSMPLSQTSASSGTSPVSGSVSAVSAVSTGLPESTGSSGPSPVSVESAPPESVELDGPGS